MENLGYVVDFFCRFRPIWFLWIRLVFLADLGGFWLIFDWIVCKDGARTWD